MPGASLTLREAWSDPDNLATTLVVLAFDLFGAPDPGGEEETPWYGWSPEALLENVRDETGAQLQGPAAERLFAGAALIGTDLFATNLHAFIDLCLVLAGGHHDPRWWEPADASDCAWGLTEATYLDALERPAHREDRSGGLAEDIKAYVGKVCAYEGVFFPPAVLRLGTGTEQLAARVRSELGDDPALAASALHGARERQAAIENFVKQRQHLLAGQLQRLPLTRGHAARAIERLLSSNQL